MLITPSVQNLLDAAKAIQRGELVAFPTDTFYALGADGLNTRAVESVFAAKGRNPQTPVPLLLSHVAMAEDLINEFPEPLRALAEEFWPGALTIVLPASSAVPEAITAGTRTVGLRVPDHRLACELIELAGTPVTGTSCNLTGQPPSKSSQDIVQQFRDKIAFCLDAPCGEHVDPSTVVSMADNRPTHVKLLRTGAISETSIRNIIGDFVAT
ncbi:MAG: L-threonylcarbamoyladenylate synthase [Chloroflexi bacterium]|nr:L-threonylcarbamoyladenylate synthase [Chloroflexota bacterium]